MTKPTDSHCNQSPQRPPKQPGKGRGRSRFDRPISRMSRADFALLQVLELHIKSITAADRRAALCAVAARLRVLARRDAQRVDIVLP